MSKSHTVSIVESKNGKTLVPAVRMAQIPTRWDKLVLSDGRGWTVTHVVYNLDSDDLEVGNTEVWVSLDKAKL